MATKSPVDRINSLSVSKRERLVESLLDKWKKKKTLSELKPRIAGTVKASLDQERLWFLDQLEPGNPAYLLPNVVRLQGRLNVPGLEQSLSELIRRHESLRTSFRSDGASVLQEIASSETLSLPVVDISGLGGEDREKISRQLMRDEARRVFQLTKSPLLRGSLLRSSDQEHFLLLNVHHIVADAWSMTLVIQEVGVLHEAYAGGRPSPIEELKIQFADYASWQRETLQQPGVLDAKLEYWKSKLLGAPTVLEFPTDRPRPIVQRFRGATNRFEIDETVTDAIRRIGLEERVTPFMIMLAAFGVLLYKYTGQESIVIGSPVANRQNPDLEKVIGFFVNTVALRIDVNGESDYRGLIAKTREMVLGAYEHQDLPLGALLEHLAVQRDPNRSPLFQVMFGVQNVDTPALELEGIKLMLVDIDAAASKFDFTVMIHDLGKEMAGTIEYNTDLFEGSTIKRLENHFKALLEVLTRDADRRISEISIFSESERQQLLVEWNDTNHRYAEDACIHDLFRFEAAQRPDQVALVHQDEHVTYYELDARSNQLANYLIRKGIKQEQLIGVFMERGVSMVVALLGILKAGAAYLPLDPRYPVKRLEFMLEDASPSMLITQGQEMLPRYAETLHLDTDWEEITQQSTAKTDRSMTAANAAYVLYTSGSTGQPKGVVGLHGGILNRVNWMWRAYPFTSMEICCAKTSLNFVDSVWEIFGPLTRGITLILISDEDVKDANQLIRVLDDQRVTRLVLVPSLLQAMLSSDVDLQKALPHLRIWVTSGEALSKELLESFIDRLPGRRLLNLYGSSEIAGDVTAHPASEASLERNVSIGRPISNSQVYSVDRHLEAAPIGAWGELLAGGRNLARGYLNRPELTAERFVPNRFNGDGDRLFKTGDVVRQLDNGDIEYLGRIDHQVKIRGYRIELGEIEAALNLHPLVRESVALVSDNDARDNQLVAYFVAKSEAEPAPAELQRFLQSSLPAHMLPAFFVCLPQMPLLPNGKINRRALPKPEFKADPARYSGPRNAVEELLCGIWTDVLGVEQIGINDSFFELGGHSLVAAQVISRVRDALQVEVGLRVLFENPTVGGLAEAVERERRAGTEAVAPEMVRVERGGELQASYAQQRLWFIQQLAPNSAAYNIPISVRLEGSLNVSALRQTLREIARRHEVLRTRFVSREAQTVQVIDEPLEIDLPIVDLTGLMESQRESAAEEIARREAGRPFDLARGPVWRSTLVRTKPDEHLLVVIMHHIASDGWSAGIMLKEFTELYEAGRAGHRSSLPELSIQYADYALWQRGWLRGEVLEQQLEYWRRQLAALPILELPVDRPRTAEENRRAAMQGLKLPEDLTQKLFELNRREGMTLFMTLLAGFQLLLARYTGQEEIAVGAPVSGRNRSETEGLIGFFVNMLVLRTDLSGAPTLRELLRRVRKTALDAYAHQDVPFEKLVEELHPARSLSRHPFFEILFNHVNLPLSEERVADLTLAHSRIAEAESRFPMTVHVSQNDGQINLQIVYQQALFSSSRIAAMLDQYRELLSQMVEQPGQAIASYSLVTSQSRPLLPDPREELIQPSYDPVGDMFNEWAIRLPRQVAVSHKGREWSYADLSERARDIAGELISSGLESGRTVMVTGEKSLGMIASVLATCMSGGVLFTLDRALPADRQRMMSDTADVTHILYVGEVRGEDAWMFECGARCVLKVDPGSGAVTRRSQEGACDGNRPAAHLRFLPQISTREPAYIFFTSGTTGVPKGVLGNHRGLSHFLKWQRDEFEIGPGDRSAQLIGLSFDAVLRDIFLPLTSGATLCLPDDEETVSSEKILGWLDRQHISVLHTVPALAQMWLTSPPPNLHLKDLRIIFFAGEPLPDSLVKAWRELSSNRCEIVNLYGPTETTLTKCYYRVPVDCPAGRQSAGGPMPHTQALILRDGHQLCGIGELGEVAIRTPFRTLGYIDGDELNRQRFVKNPFRDDDHDLIYITGDLARYREDGLIELAGRVDDQVKIRGIRVEPGEIETVLARHPGVKRCVVVAREDEPGNKRLIAYVVPAGESPTAKSELREHLRRKLPDYMVPATFVEVLELPLTANGKIDRAALPSPDYALAQEPYVGPRSVVEQILVQIWSEVLRLDQIGIYNTFFELGGHSLLATQVISRIHDTFHVDIPLRHLFEHPTVENLASIIEQSQMEQIGDDSLSELLTRLSLLSDNEVESSLAGHGFS